MSRIDDSDHGGGSAMTIPRTFVDVRLERALLVVESALQARHMTIGEALLVLLVHVESLLQTGPPPELVEVIVLFLRQRSPESVRLLAKACDVALVGGT